MFESNTKYAQKSILSPEHQFSDKKRKQFEKSWGFSFRREVFSNIIENIFACLYSDVKSRPNFPVNVLVGALILMEIKNWSVNELIEELVFNPLARVALGFQDPEEKIFCEATLYNFLNKIDAHKKETGVNLFETVFNSLTAKQITDHKIKLDIQRSDSCLVSSNICNYSRTQLIVECIIRLYKILSPEEQENLKNLFEPYIKQNSEHYIYNLKPEDSSTVLQKTGAILFTLQTELGEKYKDNADFQVFLRVFHEHYKVKEGVLAVRPKTELHSSCIQSPDDLEATYRKKGSVESKGFSCHVTETCSPENELNLLTDISLHPNNVDDSKILEERLELMKEKMPELNVLYTDGGYGSASNDELMEKLDIKHIQTAIRGRKSEAGITVKELEDGTIKAVCKGKQEVEVTKTKKKLKAKFDKTKCESCPFAALCPAYKNKKNGVYYFDENLVKMQERHRAISELPPEERNLRPNVEATIKQIKCGRGNIKSKFRGLTRLETSAFCKAIGINFGRIRRYKAKIQSFDHINDPTMLWQNYNIILQPKNYIFNLELKTSTIVNNAA